MQRRQFEEQERREMEEDLARAIKLEEEAAASRAAATQRILERTPTDFDSTSSGVVDLPLTEEESPSSAPPRRVDRIPPVRSSAPVASGPPPPPPSGGAAPPPPPPPGPSARGTSSAPGANSARGALLDSIRQGTNLKRTPVTRDASAPTLKGSGSAPSPAQSSSASRRGGNDFMAACANICPLYCFSFIVSVALKARRED